MEEKAIFDTLKAVVAACAALVCAACSNPSSNNNNASAGFSVQTSTPPNIEASADAPHSAMPHAITCELTVSRVEDLKVKSGQHVRAGDVLTDRLIERAPLEAARKQAEIALEMMIHPKHLPQSKIAPAFYVDAETAITRAEKSEADARRKVETTDARIAEVDRLASLPPAVRATIGEHETATRAQLERDRTAAELELKLAKAQLESAKQIRSTAEYMTARDNLTQSYTEDNAIQTARMTEAQQRAQIASLDYQIGLLGQVRAPFAGTIKRISWEGQQDHDVKVVLTIAVDADVGIQPGGAVTGDRKGKAGVSGFTRRMRPTAYRAGHC